MQEELLTLLEDETDDRQRMSAEVEPGMHMASFHKGQPGALDVPARHVMKEKLQHDRLRRHALLCLAIGTLLAVVIGVGGTSTATHVPTLQVGQMVFSSSGQLDPTSSTGLNDTITLTLHNLALPAPNTHYVAWLLPDGVHAATPAVWLGTLSLNNSGAQLTYVQPEYHNLLATFSTVCLTLERDGRTARPPTTDTASWRYAAIIPTTPTPGDEHHYSLLDHLRHLLGDDPTLEQLGLSGGLGIWLYRNVGKLFEWSNAARDNWAGGQSTDLIHRHMLRILDDLDGVQYAWRDVPAGSSFLADPQASHIGLLSFTPDQIPPGYLPHVGIHLQGVAGSPGHTDAQVRLAASLQQTLNQITTLAQHIRQDALQLVTMNAAQLQQPQALSLLNDMTTAATTAYAGQGQTNGIVWLQGQLAQLATLPVTTYQTGNA